MDKKVERAIRLFQKGHSYDQFPQDLVDSFDRWNTAHELTMKYHHKGMEFVRELFKIRYSLNDTSARQDLRCAEMFFGKMKQSNRAYERIIRIEFLKKQSYAAAAEGKYKEVAQLEAIIQKYLDPSHDPIDMPDWEELRLAVQPVIMYDPEILGVKRIPASEVSDLWNKVQRRKNLSDFAEDAEFTEANGE
ncbi:MAG: hypothetical protein WC760_06425 [Bacteroidia bacterium]|jgi:hypothetical protein